MQESDVIQTGPCCVESPVEIFVNGTRLATLLCTPSQVKELAAGWLRTQGLISGLDDLESLAACDEMAQVYAKVRGVGEARAKTWRTVLTSGCGGGALRAEALVELPSPVRSDFSISLAELRLRMKEMLSQARLYHDTGGVHGAALSGAHGLVAQAEDVGRHNAVDKVIGAALFAGLDPTRSCLLSTGRLSAEMVVKAAELGVPVVASLSIPTSLAVEIATKAGITLVGRAASSTPFLYGCQAHVSECA